MSTEYNAAAIVGCKIDKSKVFFTEEVRSCKHPIPMENAKFCPECGKNVFLKHNRAIPQYDWDEESTSGFSTICGFTVFNYECNDFLIVAGKFTKTDFYSEEPEMLDISTINDVLLKLKLALEPCGLWDEKQFGIHVFQWCS